MNELYQEIQNKLHDKKISDFYLKLDDSQKKELYELIKKDDMHNSSLLYHLGYMYYNGYGVEQKRKKALNIWTEIAYNNIYAALALANMYEYGIKVDKDENKAIEYYQIAANEDNADGQYNLAYHYEKNNELDKMEKLLLKAASQNHISAMFNLAMYYNKNNKNDEAIYWWKKGADYGDTDALYSLGSYYYNQQNFNEAYKWYLKALEKGDIDAFKMIDRILRKNKTLYDKYLKMLENII